MRKFTTLLNIVSLKLDFYLGQTLVIKEILC